jgi:Protein of unknown function (DUF2829)
MNFGQALEALKQGKKVKRKHWGGYWFISQPVIFEGLQVIEKDGQKGIKADSAIGMNPTIIACLKDNGGYVPATAYQEDLLAEDWEVVE